MPPYGPAEEGEGEENSRKIGLGLCAWISKGFNSVKAYLLRQTKKNEKKNRILISRPNSTPKQKSKNYYINDRIQTKTAGNTYPLAFCKRIWLKINVESG